MIPLGSQILSPASEGIGFSELMVVMAILSGAGSGSGHMELFETTPLWLERWYLSLFILKIKNLLLVVVQNILVCLLF